MRIPSWSELYNFHCTKLAVDNYSNLFGPNPHSEKFASRRYNYAASSDKNECRLVFLRSVLEDPTNKTLNRDGRFIWCKDLHYEGKDSRGFRSISFTVDKGKKRFTVAEDKILCLPSKICVNNSAIFRRPGAIFENFSTVFSYDNTLKMMAKNSGLDYESFVAKIEVDNPFSIGSLVVPKLGYFYPKTEDSRIILGSLRGRKEQDRKNDTSQHPVGLIVGNTPVSDYIGKEFYRVRFADTTYEKVHPVQMEVLSEI